jgi:hypothetical protein
VSGVAVGDLLQLMSGAQRGRMYEIVGLSGAHVTICPSFPDASSLGAHLTPHLTRLAPDQPGAVPNHRDFFAVPMGRPRHWEIAHHRCAGEQHQ